MKWISVKDRLPNETIPVLAINSLYEYFVLELNSGEWFDHYGEPYTLNQKFDIIYWMPLEPLPDGVITKYYTFCDKCQDTHQIDVEGGIIQCDDCR